jgi:hypothetical protein
MRFRLRARRCQHCCNVIGKWASLTGILNCGDCVRFMSTGRAPRCRVTGRMGLHHEHGQEIK